MGAGKTTLGRELSKKILVPFFDLDHMMEEKEKLSIPQIFKDLGELSFRSLEGKYLKEFPYPEKFILSTGGGTPCYFDHMDWMNQKGITVYLRLSPKSLANRLLSARDQDRPLIRDKKGNELLEFVEEKLREREEFYLKSQIILKGENLKVQDIIESLNDFIPGIPRPPDHPDPKPR